tara:strand:- start:316 stop:591 length:276 start_codon:yes stop_codon:yes gene_type:complete
MENNSENKYLRKFVCSDELFSGFSTFIDLREVETKEDICIKFKKILENVLQEYNFENLLDNLRKKIFHLNDIKMETILTSDIDDLFYVCFY